MAERAPGFLWRQDCFPRPTNESFGDRVWPKRVLSDYGDFSKFQNFNVNGMFAASPPSVYLGGPHLGVVER